MQKIIKKCKRTVFKAYLKTKNFLSNTDGDQITGWRATRFQLKRLGTK